MSDVDESVVLLDNVSSSAANAAIGWLIQSGETLLPGGARVEIGAHPDDEELLPAGVDDDIEDPNAVARRAHRNWAAEAVGTLQLLFESLDVPTRPDIDHSVATLLGELVRAEPGGEAEADVGWTIRELLDWLRVSQERFPQHEWMGTPPCPLCRHETDRPSIRSWSRAGTGVLHVTCRSNQPEGVGYCGAFLAVGCSWFGLIEPKVSIALAWYRRTRERRGLRASIYCPGELSPAEGIVSLADVRAAAPTSLAAIHDELLLTLDAIARQDHTFGSYADVGPEDTPLAMAPGYVDLDYHLDELAKQGLIEQELRAHGFPGRLVDGQDASVRLTGAGRRHVEELERGTVDKPNQGFVAMWFDPELEHVYREAIEPAIRDAGFDAMQMAFLEHNDDITDRIIAEIRKSRFVVADFTGNRGGVYFEAGFALGLGKTVIWTCRRDFFEESGVHFDTQARNHILWDEPEDLRRSLQARIEATVPR